MPEHEQDGHVMDDDVLAAHEPKVDEFVPVTVQVHVDDLTSFYEAIAEWSRTAGGGKGRMRVS